MRFSMSLVLRWAMGDLRVYAENKLGVYRTLRNSGMSAVASVARAKSAIEAGCWHEVLGHVRPDWDGAKLEEGPNQAELRKIRQAEERQRERAKNEAACASGVS